LEIRDWLVARELDVAAARLLHDEELTREFEREKRDREFWIAMFGGNKEQTMDQSSPIPLNQLSPTERRALEKFSAEIKQEFDIEKKKPGRRTTIARG
jgi:hypothetical protein